MKPSSTLCLCLVAALAGPLSARQANIGPGPLHKLRLESGQTELLEQLRRSGSVVREVDYGAFRMVVVDEAALGGREALSQWPVRDDWNTVLFDGLPVDGTRPEASLDSLPATLRSDDGAGLYVVQFEGPVKDEWFERLQATGIVFSQYVPMHAYVVQLAPEEAWRLYALRDERPEVQFVAPYHPAYRLTPELRAASHNLPGEILPITVQLTRTDGARAAIEELRSLSVGAVDYEEVGDYVNLKLDVQPTRLIELASHPHVFAVEPRGVPWRNDERQGQIVAGNVSGPSPTGPGYLAWLAAAGFDSSQFGSFSVNVVDDAISLMGHADVPNSRVAFEENPSNQTGQEGGHGFLNAHIVAGFNDATGTAFEDAADYNYGLGIAPWAQVGTTAIFGSTNVSLSGLEATAYGLGARISTNSWSFIDGAQNPIPDYDSSSQTYDVVTRDALSGTAGNQEYLVLFAAGNDGPGGNTISTPSTAKNIVTVGASENDRPTGTDGCGISNSGADDLRDVISFSSQGPVDSSGGDGRWKPELVAPGTHVQAGVPQSNFDGGSSVCNGAWPAGQTLYGWSSGTSHSTPAVAGGGALVYQWFLNEGLGAPSPAMVKAILVNGCEYLTGVNANDTLPSQAQGMGLMNLDRAFGGEAFMRVDQDQLLGSTGATHVVQGTVANSGEPFRVSLVWTDAPGATTGAPWVNDLDLTVDVGGALYRGNVFSGATSTTGGSADFRNNTESVFLPAGTTGAFTVTVTASGIAGDGVPGNGDATDQDFALVVYNGTAAGTFAQFSGTPTSGDTPLSVDFTDLSQGDFDSWSWDFGDTGTSSQQNPSHVYTAAGTYSVALTVDGNDGQHVETKTNYIVVSDPPPPGLSDPSFELQTANTAPASPWSTFGGSSHVISPSGATTDSGMPSDGAQWCELAGDGTNNATPPSNPGGATAPPVGGAGVSQTFRYGAGATEFEFEAAFLRNEDANSTYNDWMSVDITDGTTTHNLYFKDTFSATSGTSAKYGYAMTAVETVQVDLLVLFPSSTTSTDFTLTAQVGNGTDGIQPSKGYVDNFQLISTAPAADFTVSPGAGQAPLSVAFTDTSVGATSWSWDFGDGDTSTDQNPVHVYTFPGDYTVSLTATGASGSDVETQVDAVQVSFPPAVGSNYGTGSAGSLGVPQLQGYAVLAADNPLYLHGSNLPASTPLIFMFSTSAMAPAANLSNGFMLNVGLPIAVMEPGTSNGAGEAFFVIVQSPDIAGLTLYSQVLMADGTGGDFFSCSQGLQVSLP